MWSVDGLVVTDMTATGGSPSYFDFDAFQEIAVTTGGADLQVQAGGIGINLVTKRGTNKFHGGARGFLTHDDLQSSNLPAALVGDPRLENPDGTLPRQGRPHPADQRLRVRPRRPHPQGQAVVLRRAGASRTSGSCAWSERTDKTLLTSYNAKLNWQATGNTMVSAFFFDGVKEKYRAQPGLRPQRAGQLPLGPGERLRGEPAARAVEARGEPDLLAELLRVGQGRLLQHRLRPVLAEPGPELHATTTWPARRWGTTTTTSRCGPRRRSTLDGNYFAQGLGGSHELKFGFGYREVDHVHQLPLDGQPARRLHQQHPTDREARLYREGSPGAEGKYLDLYVGDVFTRDRLSHQPRRALGQAEGQEPPARLRPTRPSRTGCPGSSTRATRATRSTGRTSRRASA